MNKKRQIVIGISGASCSGKSWLAKQIQGINPSKISLFEIDRYYKDFEYVKTLKFQHDNPDAIDYEMAFNNLQKLMDGKEINIPIYDYDSHKVCGWHICQPTPMIIVEGLFAFTDKRLRETMDFRIWIEADENIRFERRIERDTIERGDNFVDAKHRYEQDVIPAYNEFIFRYKEYADLVYINNKLNVSSSLYKCIEILADLFNEKDDGNEK